MSLQFGLTLAIQGIATVFLTIIVIIAIFEILKRKFKGKPSQTLVVEKPVETHIPGELSDEEKAAVTAAIAAAISEGAEEQRSTVKFSVTGFKPWCLAGRLELMSRGGKIEKEI